MYPLQVLTLREVKKIEDTVKTVKENKFEKCFQPVPEKFRGKETGNQVLNPRVASFALIVLIVGILFEKGPAVKSQAKEPAYHFIHWRCHCCIKQDEWQSNMGIVVG